MTTNMNFGPEWMRGNFPKRSNTLESQTSMRSMLPTNSYSSGTGYAQTESFGNREQTMLFSSTATEEPADTNTFKYSREFMLSLYKPSELPVDFERHEYAAVEESLGPLAFEELSETEKKYFEQLLAGPVHSDVSRRIISNSDKNERGERTNVQRNHRDMYSSPMHSPASENAPLTPGRMNMTRSKGRVGDYFARDRDHYGKRNENETMKRWESHSSIDQNPDAPSPNKSADGESEEPAWGGVNRDTLGSFDSNGVFRLGSATGTGDSLEEAKPYREWHNEDAGRGKNFRHQSDEVPKDVFNNQFKSATDHSSSAFSGVLDQSLSSNMFGSNADLGSGAASSAIFGGGLPNSDSAPRKPVDRYKWFYRDPSGNIQGPFEAQEMQEWYKAGFFSATLLVKREDEARFEPLASLIRMVGNEDQPFLVPYPQAATGASTVNSRHDLSGALPSHTRGITESFGRGPSSATTMFGSAAALDSPGANLFGAVSGGGDVSAGYGSKYHPFGGISGISSSFLNQPMSPNPTTPQGPSVLQGHFNSFGSSLLGTREGVSPWGEVPRTPSWLANNQNDVFASANLGMSPLLQRQQQQQQQPTMSPLFASNMGSNSGLLDYQRAMNDQLEQHQHYMQLLQQKQQQHLQFQQQLQQQQLQQQQLQHQQQQTEYSSPMLQTQQLDLQQNAFKKQVQSLEQASALSPVVRAANANALGGWSSVPGTPLGTDAPSSPWGSIVAPAIPSKVSEELSSKAPGAQSPRAPSSPQVKYQPTSQQKTATTEKDQDSTQTDGIVQSVANINIEDNNDDWKTPVASPVTKQQTPPKKMTTSPTISFPAVKPVSLREIQAEEMRKQEEIKQKAKAANVTHAPTTVSTESVPPKAAGWNSAPWARESVAKGPSLREIQELEAKEAEIRKEAERQAAESTIQQGSHTNASPSTNLSWGVVVPPKASTTNGTSVTSSSSSISPAWGATSAPKKTLREIQQEEEEALKKKAKAQQASLMTSNLGATPSTVKGYAGVAGTAKISSQNNGGAWTTVTSNRSTAKVVASSTTSSITTATQSATARSSQSNGSASLASTPSQPAASRRVENEQKSPSDDFCRWCKQTLRGLNAGVNADEILQMLLSFPLDGSSAEIIQDIIYANSTSMDGRRFAEEFMKRRKADLAGKLNVIVPLGSTVEDDSFTVVTKKGKKKQQA
ncbi:hypothetical protein EC973_004796 [Apophysomyces ossiformis]|uniref:GYF domain-containing protein n=1 Tax=Apophysomyces ossiformis TaxID=679940 RepID=A0A8H7BSR1_9FUNG|nr:hypothetical protein EC973_004796 [Apophysomyces ossiformis]